MKFKMEIKMDNAAFTEMPERELDRILQDVGQGIVDGVTYGFCRDLNGNTVGTWEIETD